MFPLRPQATHYYEENLTAGERQQYFSFIQLFLSSFAPKTHAETILYTALPCDGRAGEGCLKESKGTDLTPTGAPRGNQKLSVMLLPLSAPLPGTFKPLQVAFIYFRLIYS